MDSNLTQRRRGLEEKIPDIRKTLSMVEYLRDRRVRHRVWGAHYHPPSPSLFFCLSRTGLFIEPIMSFVVRLFLFPLLGREK